ncbi:TonB-dependent receptor plug domain-containing protein [Acinetobacter sp. 194]|uniref:TonB-dependent receptor plug domain-containing protein n=1 Tax=Acinetobacter shaoyimingii TaxID=2715164 RepID=UPI00140A3FCB|nr:TonB-dependent receptor plug domain-containing protein [Acinetobacter shaoyimingii]NHB57885.1 TonB-dependent receptor plug domain-containing protein [Acinetobacter shaoyimingii]
MKFAYSPLRFAIFAAMNTHSFAANDVETNKNNVNASLQTIVVEAKEKSEVGNTVYSKDQLESMPNSKKSITDFLKTNSNVQFSRDANSAGTQGSLAPDKISINGAPNFANKFVVNGVNTSNTFDPVGESADANYYGMPSNSQTANINTDLLCELEVIDSNAGAEHGDFLGGVIQAKTCAPQTEIGQIHGSLSYDYTTDAWARFNYLNETEETSFEEKQDATHNREYTIHGSSANFYGRMSEKLGLSLNLAKRNSVIPVISGFVEGEKVKTEENNDSIGLTLFYTPNATSKYQFGIEHYNYDKEGYYKNTLNSNYNIDTITHSFFINNEKLFEQFKLEQNLNYRTSELNRELKQNYSVNWAYSPISKNDIIGLKDGSTYTMGGYGGDLINEQKNLSYDAKLSLNAFDFLQMNHQIKLGFGYNHNKGTWERNNDMALYTGTGYDNNTTKTDPQRGNLRDASCAIGDYLCDEGDLNYRPTTSAAFEQWNGQYLRKGTLYGKGKFTARQDQWNVFIEDSIAWKNFKARFGVRADYESLASNLNIAPRTNIEYLPFHNDKLKFLAGFNRYYGTTYLSTELDAKAYLANADLSRGLVYLDSWDSSNNYGWIKKPKTNVTGTEATDLKTPYSDERVFAINSQLANMNIGLKWVNRTFKNQIREQQPIDDQSRTYKNVDGGKSDTYTLNVASIQPIDFLNIHHNLSLGVSYIDNKTFTSDYKVLDNSNADYNTQVYFKGQVFNRSDLPTKDSPITARLTWDMKAKNIPLSWNNFFYYRDKSTNYVNQKDEKNKEIKMSLPNGKSIYVIEEKSFSSKFTWDTRLTYTAKTQRKQDLIFGLTVNNVLNKHNLMVTDSGTLSSEIGRQFIADVSFKF